MNKESFAFFSSVSQLQEARVLTLKGTFPLLFQSGFFNKFYTYFSLAEIHLTLLLCTSRHMNILSHRKAA